MADILPLRATPAGVPAAIDPLLALPRWAREEAELRQALLLRADRHEPTPVSAATLRRWREARESGGLAALVPHYKGKNRKSQLWEARALELVQLPSRMNAGEIAANLRADGFGAVTPAQVRRWRKTLPSHLDETSPKKLGRHHYRLNETPYVVRDHGNTPVGYLYEMDGHTCDFYIEHPTTGGYFRPELTFLTDVRSQYIVDFWLGTFENGMELSWLLSRAFLAQDHVCHELHVDPGAARGKRVSHPVTGFCAKLDVDIHFALPGNARGKGLIEGEYKHFEGRFGKVVPTYLHNRTDDEMRLFAAKWKRNEVPRITVRQLYDLILRRYVTPRRTDPRDGLDGQSAADLWATLQKNPVIAPAAALCRPRDARTVQNGRITLHKRRYELPMPQRAAWEDREVVVEYDDWRDEQVWIYDAAGIYLCEAPLVHRQAGIPISRVQEKLARTLDGQTKRLQLKLAEADARSRVPLMPAQMLETWVSPETPSPIGDAEQVLRSGTSFTQPVLPAPRAPKPVNPAFLQRLERELEAEAAEVETETAADRFSRAERLLAKQEAAEELAEADARWLAIYTTSPEFRAQRLMAEARAERDEEAACDSGSGKFWEQAERGDAAFVAPAPAPTLRDTVSPAQERALSAATDAPSFLPPLE